MRFRIIKRISLLEFISFVLQEIPYIPIVSSDYN